MICTKTVAFFGHGMICKDIDENLNQLLRELVNENEYVEFLVGRNGDFDRLVSSAIRRLKRSGWDANSSHVLVLPYLTAEFRDNEESFFRYYDEVEVNVFPHPKGAIQARNRKMIDRADLIICYIDHLHGGAYQSVRYAKKAGKKIYNLYPLTL